MLSNRISLVSLLPLPQKTVVNRSSAFSHKYDIHKHSNHIHTKHFISAPQRFMADCVFHSQGSQLTATAPIYLWQSNIAQQGHLLLSVGGGTSQFWSDQSACGLSETHPLTEETLEGVVFFCHTLRCLSGER